MAIATYTEDMPRRLESPLRRARKTAKLSMAELARRAKTSRQQIERLETGEVRVSKDWAERLAPILQVAPEILIFDETTAALIGYAGAGAEVSYFAEGQGPFDRVKMPPGGSNRTVGVEIRGDSLGTLLNGWIAYYEDRREPPTDDLIGRLCVVGIEGGHVLIKRIARRGRGPGTFDLSAPNTDVMFDQRVEWAAEVTAFLPR